VIGRWGDREDIKNDGEIGRKTNLEFGVRIAEVER
jgi:hypothetical protein